MPLLPLILALLVAVSGVYTWYRVRSLIGLLECCCDIAGGVAFALWSRDNDALVDRVTGTTGLGLLIFVVAVDLCLLLQFACTVTLCEQWSWWYRGAGVIGVILTVLTLPLWLDAHTVAGRDIVGSLYDGYHGRPPALLRWNVFVGASFIYQCALIEHAVWAIHLPPGLYAAVKRIMTIVYGAGLLYGVLIAAQAIADVSGLGATSLRPALNVVWIGAIMLTAGAALSMTILPPARRYYWLWRDLRELRTLRRDLVRLQVLLSDRLVRLVPYANPCAVELVAARCRAVHLQPYGLTVAVEAARWISVRRAILARQPWRTVDAPTARAIDEAIVKDAAVRAQHGTYLYADVYRVIAQALGPRYIPAWLGPRDNSEDWHRAIAWFIADVMCTTASVAAPADGAFAAIPMCMDARPDVSAHRMWPLLRTSRMRGALVDMRKDLIALGVACSDRFVYLHDHIAATPAIPVPASHWSGHWSPYQDRVAREAARWLTLYPRDAVRPLRGAARLWAAQEKPAPGRRDAPVGLEDIHAHADVSRILLAALHPAHVPAGVVRGRWLIGWRRCVAAMVATEHRSRQDSAEPVERVVAGESIGPSI